jgi:Tfp pilus assembly protein PilV
MKPFLKSALHRRRHRDRGFTLVEIPISLMVFAIGVLTVAALISAGIRSGSKAGGQTRASEMASQCVERLLSTPNSDSTMTAGSHQDNPYPYPGGYYLTWVIEDNQPISLCKRVTVTVHWPTATAANPVRLVAISPQADDQTP